MKRVSADLSDQPHPFVSAIDTGKRRVWCFHGLTRKARLVGVSSSILSCRADALVVMTMMKGLVSSGEPRWQAKSYSLLEGASPSIRVHE